jgi:hypothetical protein
MIFCYMYEWARIVFCLHVQVVQHHYLSSRTTVSHRHFAYDLMLSATHYERLYNIDMSLDISFRIAEICH